ncbi:acyltransferase family protein [Rhodoblastus sp.]|uniref:acyltransferase family protein n=1 Tax=Rhodoblastus sp. TaxID=1962975 RepID=UPI003F9ABDAA
MSSEVNRLVDDANSARYVPLDYLRATLTLMVVAHHSSLAYTNFAHIDSKNYLASTAPVVDEARWLFLDYAENFNDVFFMSLMFFISGLFVLPSLRRSGAAAFLSRRFLRLGLPFAVGVTVLMPAAYYAAWRAAGHHEGYLDYWLQNITMHGWPPGPLWFVWMLLLFDAAAAAIFAVFPRRTFNCPSDSRWFIERPLPAFGVMVVVCALMYLPMLSTFGFGVWAPLLTKPFYFQVCRIGLYLAWFFAGALVGAQNLDRGLLARERLLARNWRWWLAGCIVAYNLLIFVPRSHSLIVVLSARGMGALESILWVISCVASCFGFLALFRGVVCTRRPWMDSLARSAYAIYLVHYVFVLWAQFILLDEPLPASIKFATTFAFAVLFSWMTAQALLWIPGARHVL